jgi:hypothetical protein
VAGTFLYKLRFEGVFACPAAASGDAFLADCNSVGYSDYDHGAFWFGLEPEAQRDAREAEVMFLGSSRLQFALSTAATRSWFSTPPVSYYLLGFSHTENVAFVQPLLQKIRPLAKVYVINVDRFFSESETTPAAELLHDRDAQSRYTEKRFWQRLQRPVCTTVPAICGREVAFVRSRQSGAWNLIGSGPFKAAPVADGPATDVEHWPEFAGVAENFVSQLPVSRDCVILTIVPYQATKRDEARAIATALQLDLVAPKVDDLTTFDGSHLDSSSAERWTAAFFELAGPRIRRCLADDLTTSQSLPSSSS